MSKVKLIKETAKKHKRFIPLVEDIFKYDMKHSVFNVKENFEMEDIMNFMDYCFTHLTWGAVNIELMSNTDNHFYALKCPNHYADSRDGTHFFLVPVRIVQQCLEEDKEYTRAKCNGCSLNIVVYFNQIPEKFNKIIKKNDIFKSDAPSDSKYDTDLEIAQNIPVLIPN